MLGGCAEDGAAVYVQSVQELSGMSSLAAGDKFPGMVVSENVAEIKRDSDKAIEELLVKEGDDVTEGQILFSYDTDELQLTLDKQRLELEQLNAMVENYTSQIAQLETEKANASSGDQLRYTVEIQTLQVDLKEAELNINAKKAEIARSEAVLENVEVTSPVTGRVQSINESGTDSYGNPAAYITIQQAGSYRIKGTMGELQMGAIMEGVRVKILSRTDETKFWTGTVTLVDYESATQGSDMDMYYGVATDPMSSSSKYPFYVELDSTEGLLLGQHVYIQVDTGDEEISGLSLSSFFVVWDEDGSTYVWAERNGKLEKRPVVLGDYDPMTDTYLVLEGLSETDYIAFPDPEICVEGAPASREMEGEVAMP
jgi:HlyD family secretion protein